MLRFSDANALRNQGRRAICAGVMAFDVSLTKRSSLRTIATSS